MLFIRPVRDSRVSFTVFSSFLNVFIMSSFADDIDEEIKASISDNVHDKEFERKDFPFGVGMLYYCHFASRQEIVQE